MQEGSHGALREQAVRRLHYAQGRQPQEKVHEQALEKRELEGSDDARRLKPLGVVEQEIIESQHQRFQKTV